MSKWLLIIWIGSGSYGQQNVVIDGLSGKDNCELLGKQIMNERNSYLQSATPFFIQCVEIKS